MRHPRGSHFAFNALLTSWPARTKSSFSDPNFHPLLCLTEFVFVRHSAFRLVTHRYPCSGVTRSEHSHFWQKVTNNLFSAWRKVGPVETIFCKTFPNTLLIFVTMRYSFSERVARAVFQTCKRFHFSDLTDRIFSLHWNFSAFVCWKSKHTVYGFWQRTKIRESWISSGRLFPVPHGVVQTLYNIPRCKREKKHSRDFFCKAACFCRLHCFKAKAIRTDLLRNFGRSNNVQYTSLGRRTLCVHFLGPRCQIPYLKEIELHHKKNNFLLFNIFEPLPFSPLQQVHSFLEHLFGAAMCGAVFIAYFPFGDPTRGSPRKRPCCFLTQHFLWKFSNQKELFNNIKERLKVKLPTIYWQKSRREKVKRKKMQMREKVGKKRNSPFFQMILGVEK